VSKKSSPLVQRHQDLQAKTVAALERLARVLAACQWETATASGITALQLRLLEELAAAPQRGVVALAASVRLASPTVSRTLGTLVAKGLVVEQPDARDRRRGLFSLTPQGEALVARLVAWGEPLTAALDVLSERELGQLWGALLVLLKELEARGLMARLRLCLTCRFFVPGEKAEPGFCRLLEQPLGQGELRLDCPDHEPATARSPEAAKF